MGIRVGTVVLVAELLLFVCRTARPQENDRDLIDQLDDSYHLPEGAIIDEITFTGLHAIPFTAAKSRLPLHEGEPFDSERLAAGVKALDELGWFEDVLVEAEQSDCNSTDNAGSHYQLVFHVRENPVLSEVRYSGSKVLSAERIRGVLDEKKLSLKLGVPANPAKLHSVVVALQDELAATGHPDARVVVARTTLPGQKIKVNFEIDDGAHVPVVKVHFSGAPEIPDAVLRKQMHEISPGAWFSGLRERNTFTAQKAESDRLSLLTYLNNHGFPEARVGDLEVSRVEIVTRHALPWFGHRWVKSGASVSVPLEAGARYRFGSLELSPELQAKLGSHTKRDAKLSSVEPGQAHSQHALDSLQRTWELRLHRAALRHGGEGDYRLRAVSAFDNATHLSSVKFGFDPKPAYVVRHIDFRGNRRFPDRYLRRRIGLKEGEALDEYALEAGIARIGRTGYFEPIKKQDIRIATNEREHTVDVAVHIHEKGRQRTSFSGGRAQFGSTLGIAYIVFNLLGVDEFLSTQFDGGPEALQLAIGLTEEGFLGSRGALALSLFDTFVRPRLAGGVRAPFQQTQSSGVNMGWSYAATNADAFGVNYGLSRSRTEFSFNQPAAITTSAAVAQNTTLQNATSSHSVGVGWNHQAAGQNIQMTDSVSGGLLGGNENLLKSRAEYGRIFHDDIFDSHNAWAFRATVSGTGSYQGNMPIYALLFPGDDFVRGLRDGELGPYETFATVFPSGATTYSAVPAGANMIAASNLEYRFPVWRGVKGAAFVDSGSGLMLPNWLGHSRPVMIESTNGVLHVSTGLELNWTVPGVGVPLRMNYGFNVRRLNRVLLMPDGSLFRAHDRLGVLGWGLNSLF